MSHATAHSDSRDRNDPQAMGSGAGGNTRQSMAIVTGAWLFGSVFYTAIAGAPLTLFASVLGATPFIFGLLAAAPFAASLLSLPAGVWSDRSGRRRFIFLLGLYPHRILWIAIAGVPTLLFFANHHTAALWSFVILVLITHSVGAIGGPAWMSWMADVIPRRVRGSFFARRKQLGIATALPAALLVGWIIDHYVHGANGTAEMTLYVCGGIFVAAGLFGVVDIALFHKVPHTRPAPRPGPAKSSLIEPLKDRQFLVFAAFVATLTFSSAPSGTFVTLLLVERAGVSGMTVQAMLLVMPLVGSLLTSGAWGRAVDRFGKKPVMRACGLGIAPVGLGWAAIAAHAEPGIPLGWHWIALAYVVSFCGGMMWAGIEVANFNYVLDLAGGRPGASKQGSAAGGGYVAVNSVIVNLAGVAGGVSFGIIAGTLEGRTWVTGSALLGNVNGLVVLFLLVAALRLIAVTIVLPMLAEDRRRPAREALVFVTANIYNNFQTALLQPMRFVRVRTADTFRVTPRSENP